eukprot:gi/632948004/ref/XP_007889356.1/ PREDICTED: prolyl 4-hydroxylase subunit alpha-3 isoform X2 [Callorhinchus milii]
MPCPLLYLLSSWLLSVCRGDMYASVVNIKEGIAVEKVLLQHLQTYIENESYRLGDLKRFYEKIRTLHSSAYLEPTIAISNPLLAFTLIKRLQLEWRNVVYSEEATENTQAFKDDYEKIEEKLPKAEDLEGAARGLMRLQDVYDLSTKGLVKGQFLQATRDGVSTVYRPSISITLSADDSFQIGKIAYDKGDYYHSVIWLEEAVSLFRKKLRIWNVEDEGSLEEALDHIAFSHYMIGNTRHALSFSEELLQIDSNNRRVARNVLKYEKILAEASYTEPNNLEPRRPNETHLLTRKTYESLCQTLGSQLQRSVVASGENQAAVDYRISKSAWLKETVDPLIEKLDQRITHLTGLNVHQPYAEYLQVVNYGIGGHYEPHFDHATSPNSPLYRMKSGNRVATFMIYLSAVEAGGSTAFIYANFSVPVVKNAALFWWNLHRNGQGNKDTLHAGCPVLVGDKWVANKWIREHGQEFQRRCGPDPEE